MTKYYVKDGFHEKGPLTIDEIKRLNVSKLSYVRKEDSHHWHQIVLLPEFNSGFFRRNKRKIIYSFVAVFIIGALFIIGSTILNENKGKEVYSDNYNNYENDSSVVIDGTIKITDAPKIAFTSTVYQTQILNEIFKNCNASGSKSQIMTSTNYGNSLVRNSAAKIAGRSPGSFNIGQVCEIYDYCYTNWKYVNDPVQNEIIEYASNTLKNGLNGDCDDFAVLLGSLLLSVGGEVRINYVYGPEGAHAFTELNIGSTNFNEIQKFLKKRYRKSIAKNGIWYKEDEKGNKWLNLDWFADYPGGKYFNATRGTRFYITQKYCIDFKI